MNLELYKKISDSLARRDVALVAVSKTKPPSDILAMYEAGQKVFGENRVQELADKQPRLPADIEWHMIGHLQTNKVKFIAPFVSMIEAVDSAKLLRTISKEAIKHSRSIDILLQFKIATEETKYGFTVGEVDALFTSTDALQLEGIRYCGVMGMASFVSDEDQVRSEFATLKSIFDHLKTTYFADNESFSTISMGMSGDYEIAIEEGSNMVRLGSILFGPRN